MLRARVLQERSNTYVCAFCRHKLSPRGGQLRDRSPPTASSSIASLGASVPTPSLPSQYWGLRTFSTSSGLRGPNDDKSPPKFGGLGRGGFGAGLGKFGGFGSKPTTAETAQPQSSPVPSPGLLPHEIEARQRMGLAPKKPTPKPTPAETKKESASSEKSKRQKGKGKGKRRGEENREPGSKPPPPPPQQQQQTQTQSSGQLSSSLLAEAFATDRAPRPVSTPSSWSGTQNTAANAPGASSTPSQPSWGSFSSRKVDTDISASKALSRVRATSIAAPIPPPPPPAVVSRTSAAAWGQLKRSSRSLDGAAKGGKEGAGDDFWNALEDRVNSYGSRKRGGTKGEPVAEQKPKADTTPKTLSFMDSEFTLQPRSSQAVEDTRSSRRKDRFEVDEADNDRDRRTTRKNQRYVRQDNDAWDEEEEERWEARKRRKAEKEALKNTQQEEPAAQPIYLPEYISVSNLAQALKVDVKAFLEDLEHMGFEDLTEDTIMTGDTGALIAQEYGFEPTVETGSDLDLRPRPPPEDPSLLPARPPVVTIMGHVDHGKTTLLDWLRKSSVAAQEHGGITQHIGAFVVQMSSGKQITFLDTPGHAAFLSMRQRGANVTDIVVLVVAADDSVMPQTIEALKHATAAKVPIIVAINKIDKEDARIEQVKADLARNGVEIEDYGGDVQVVPVSGKTGQGMEDLEENILTLSEILDVRSETDGMAEGWILESSVKATGKVASILVKRGTLKLGDYIVAGKTWARIRGLRNEAGIEVPQAGPGTPVEIIGWRDLPEAGEQVLQAPDEEKAKTAVEYRQEMADREESSAQLAQQEQRQREKAAAEAAAEEAAEEGAAPEPTETGLKYQNFVIKADVAGSSEAVSGTVQEIGNNEVHVRVLRSTVGPISEYDVDHAAASKSILVNFNQPVLPHIRQRANDAGIRIIDHSVIYHIADEVKAATSELLPDNISHRVLGEADVLQIFAINLKKRLFMNIAGCKVRNGAIKKSALVKIFRKGKVVYDGKINTLKHVKKDVMEMGKGTECGIGLEDFEDLQIDDQIQTYEVIRERRSL